MGIRFTCPNGHKLHVKAFLAGKRGVCPYCGAKTFIPFEAEAAPQARGATSGPQHPSPIESSVAEAGTLMDAGSPSMVIAVADPPIAKTPLAEPSSPVPPPLFTSPPPANPSASTTPQIVSQQATTAQPFVFPNATEPASAAVRYVAQRERHRRHQIVFAVLLLVAVIVLAGVLVFVLQRGTGAAPVTKTASVGGDAFTSIRHVAPVLVCPKE